MPVARNIPRAPRSGQRVVRNAAYVNRRKRRARWAALLGFALLASTFWFATDPSRILLAYAMLLGGTLLFHFGMREIAKWNARNDVRLDALLRNLGDRYTLVHFAPVGKRTIEHLLIHPGGILVLTARELAGAVSYRDGRWRKRAGGIGRLFGMGGPQLGDPSRETQANVDALAAHLAELQLEAEVDGAIVFLNPNVELDVEEPDFPVTNAEGLPEFVRSLPEVASLKPSDRKALADLFGEGMAVEQPQAAPRRRPVKRRAA